MEPWIEEICDPQRPWGLGCKLCRLAGMDNAYARGEIWGVNRVRFASLWRHGGVARGKRCRAPCQAHMRAQEIALDIVQQEGPDRRDVPGRESCMIAYRIAQAGGSYRSYEVERRLLKECGGGGSNSRRSRKTATKIVRAAAEVLRDDDRELPRKGTDVFLSMDGRKGSLVLRARRVMGDG